MHHGAPIDLVFQSIGGTEATNTSFGINLALIDEAHQAARELKRGTIGDNIMYFETGQGSSLSANAHHGVDQQTLEARAYAVARHFRPMLVNTVVGFIGPEYLYDGKQIIRAGLEDHFCGKLLGLPMGCDVCYTNHAAADQDDMDTLLTLLAVAGVNYIMGIPGGDDVMLNYQTTSFHDALYLRSVLGLSPAPEFEHWLQQSSHRQLTVQSLLPKRQLVRRKRIAMTANEKIQKQLEIYTPARVQLQRTGHSLTTSEILGLQLATAQARDAVHATLDIPALIHGLDQRRLASLILTSAAATRTDYLRNPAFGRTLSGNSESALKNIPAPDREPAGVYDIVFVIADGLSAVAVDRHALQVLDAVLPLLNACWEIAPICVVEQARVAIADPIGGFLAAKASVILIGERPGLSSPDSLGVYITWNPRPGRTDADRNCISNIRPEGLSYQETAALLHFYLTESRRLQFTGTLLKPSSATHYLLEKTL